jgi:hypothetical protein
MLQTMIPARPPVDFRRFASAAVLVALLSGLWCIPAHAANETKLEETANCIALMQTTADDLARRIKAGDKAQEPVLRTELTLAGALIARTYLEGLRDGNDAKARLNAAHQRQVGWEPERKRSAHQVCLTRADAQLARASTLERVAASRFAESRLKRMLGPR